jgi:hypothetical protein
MPDEERLTIRDFHFREAKRLFNRAWELIETADPTVEQIDEMIHSAHASRYHWSQVGQPVNLARGEWQLSRVYAVLGRAEPAVHHATRCLDLCRLHDIGDFDLAFAHEALARAYGLEGNSTATRRHARLAREAGEKIAEADDREHFFRELATVPGSLEQPMSGGAGI